MELSLLPLEPVMTSILPLDSVKDTSFRIVVSGCEGYADVTPSKQMVVL